MLAAGVGLCSLGSIQYALSLKGGGGSKSRSARLSSRNFSDFSQASVTSMEDDDLPLMERDVRMVLSEPPPPPAPTSTQRIAEEERSRLPTKTAQFPEDYGPVNG